MRLFKIKEVSEEANKFDSFIRKDSLFNMGHVGSALLATSSTYDEYRVDRIARRFAKQINENKTTIFKASVVIEYLTWAKDNLEPTTWVYNKKNYIERINRYHRAYAYYRALTNQI